MSEMIERGAEAMWRAESLRARERDRSIPWSEADEGTRVKFRWLMRAAIEVMREPTIAMHQAVILENRKDERNSPIKSCCEMGATDLVFKAAIAAALAKP